MGKRIVVNADFLETRVAVQEGHLLTELYLERHGRRSVVGSIYRGVVTNVLPGMQAAFVDIGLHKDAFLYAGDYTANIGDGGGEFAAEDVVEGDRARLRRGCGGTRRYGEPVACRRDTDPAAR